MIVLEIAFVLVNLAVPYWLWTKKTANTLPAVEQEALGKAIFRVVDASGGFPPCSTQEVVDVFQDLCDQSRKKFDGKETTSFERAGADVVFSCEVRKDEVKIRWMAESGGDHDLNCQSDRDEQIDYAPTFTFNYKGQIKTITYSSPDGQRVVEPVLGCRRKLASAKAISPVPESEEEFLRSLARLPGDTGDIVTRNRICLIFDPSADWDPFRKKFDK